MRLSQTGQTKAAVPMELCKWKRKQNNKKQDLMLKIEVLFYQSLYVWDVYGMPRWTNRPKFVCNVNFRIKRLLIYNQLSLLNVLEGPSCIMCLNTFYSFFMALESLKVCHYCLGLGISLKTFQGLNLGFFSFHSFCCEVMDSPLSIALFLK